MSDFDEDLSLPDFDEMLHSLNAMGVEIHASKVHGLLCGFLCSGKKNVAEHYLKSLGKSHSHQQEETLLRKLFDNSSQQMASMSFDFQLLLPDDEADLPLRAECLGLWCQGFIQGFELAGGDPSLIEASESRDALHHISEIAKLDFDELSIENDDERCYTDISEYVRMAALMIYTEHHGIGVTAVGSDSIH